MKISHRQNRLILRVLTCFGAFFGLLVFIYEAFIQHNIVPTISYVCYLVVTGAVLYILFARRRPNKRFAYITFYAMCFVTVLFFLSYIYQSVTFVSTTMGRLVNHIEQGEEADAASAILIKASRCCSISDEKHTTKNFQRFQDKYPEGCGNIEFDAAKSCLSHIVSQRNWAILFSCVMIIFRLFLLFLLWKYVKDEYNGNNEELINPVTALDKPSISSNTA